MKVQWEEKDIWVGRRVKPVGVDYEHIIGYHASNPTEMCTIDTRDGMVIVYTKADLVKSLNTSEMLPAELLTKRI